GVEMTTPTPGFELGPGGRPAGRLVDKPSAPRRMWGWRRDEPDPRLSRSGSVISTKRVTSFTTPRRIRTRRAYRGPIGRRATAAAAYRAASGAPPRALPLPRLFGAGLSDAKSGRSA